MRLRISAHSAAIGSSISRNARAWMRDEVSTDYNDMIYAASAADIEKKRKAFLRKWRLRCQAVADCLEEAGDRLFVFTKLPASQWKGARTTNAIERLHEESSAGSRRKLSCLQPKPPL
jgi:transposase-like protein